MPLLPPRLCSCGHALQTVQKWELIPAEAYTYQNGEFVLTASEEDDDEVIVEYRCPFCGDPLNIKNRGWFLTALKEEE